MRLSSGILAVGVVMLAFFHVCSASAQALADSDGDGLPDKWETEVYRTNSESKDSDADGFDDLTEIKQGFNPDGEGTQASADSDGDGLSDRLELLFKTDPTVKDSDGDGHPDGQEVSMGYDPASGDTKPLAKKIVIRLKKQELDQVLGGVVLATYKVSTGRLGAATPPGTYAVMNKNPRAWSNHAKLWMPWWMQFSKRGMGLHELPEWPSGKKEGESHLGTPASGGCVRLGIGPAKKLYDWTPVGTQISIVR